MMTDYHVIEKLQGGATLTAAHRRIPDCCVAASYDGRGVLDYWLKDQLARSVRCAGGMQACLDAMATVADWRDWL